MDYKVLSDTSPKSTIVSTAPILNNNQDYGKTIALQDSSNTNQLGFSCSTSINEENLSNYSNFYNTQNASQRSARFNMMDADIATDFSDIRFPSHELYAILFKVT